MRVLCVFMFYMYTIQAMSDAMWHEIILHEVQHEKELAIIVPSYNAEKWCIKNIQSILMQQYANYHVYIVVDCSTDATWQKLHDYLAQHPLGYKVTLRKNNVRQGAMANWYQSIHALADHVIVLNIDGDDWLPDAQVFARINEAYADKRVWMTFGQFRVWPDGYLGFCKRHAPDVIRTHAYRQAEWLSSHMRTYYAWLFKKIKVNDFMYRNTFFAATCDRAMMYPLLEMCAGHYHCFDEVMYIYNMQNPLADLRVNSRVQQKMCEYIKRLPAYAPLADVLITL